MAVVEGDIIRVDCVTQYRAVDDIVNVYHVRVVEPASQDDDVFTEDMAEIMDTGYLNIDAEMSNVQAFDVIKFYNITQDRPLPEEPWPSLTVGGDVLDPCALQVAGLVSFGTLVKRSIGRKYFATFPEAELDDGGNWTGTVLNALFAFALYLLSPPQVNNTLVEFGNWRYLLETFIAWNSANVDGIAATQRRRRKGVGS